VAASAYIDPVIDQLGPLTAADIETVFRKPAGRLGRDRVRKRLYAKGFPHPFERGLWSAKAVADWLASAGSAEYRSRTSERVRQISPIRSLCGSQQSCPKTLVGLKPRSLGKWRARRDSNS
jgi:hypothetical protein